MNKNRFKEGQIIAVLKEHAARIGMAELCRKHGISDATFYTWRKRYGGMEVSNAKRLKALANERRRFGYRRLHILLRPEGIEVSHKKLFRLYREERLTVCRRGGRRRAMGTRAPLTLSQGPSRRRRRLRSAERRTPLPCAGRRYVAIGRSGGARARPPHRPTQKAADGGPRLRDQIQTESIDERGHFGRNVTAHLAP